MKMFIDGKHVDASNGNTIPVLNPYTLEQIDTIPSATEEDIKAAIASAKKGQELWEKVPMCERISIMKKFRTLLADHGKELAETMTSEVGKPITQSLACIDTTLNVLDNFIECARTLGGDTYVPSNFGPSGDFVMTIHEPIGVIACIVPFNYPIELFVQKVAPALLMGNAVVIKPATDTPLSNIKMTDLLLEAGVLPQAVQLVTGSGSKIGNWLCTNPDIDSISLTGSTEVGIQTAKNAAPHLHEVGLELGGNDPLIIFEDCDIDYAVSEAVAGRNANTGQTCCASKRFIVENSIKEKFTKKLVESVKSLIIGDPTKEETQVGPLVNQRAAKDVYEQIQKTVSEGGKILCGGKMIDGKFVEPTVISDVTPDMSVANEMEIFGPVWPIIGFDTIDEAVSIANSTPYGLSSGVITNDVIKAMRVARRIDAGGVVLNGASMYRTPEQPFGGYKMTGLGQEGGRNTLLSMSLNKTLILKGVFK